MSIDNDPRPGRPRTSTDERSVKLVADALEDHRATCEELSRTAGAPATSEFCILTIDLIFFFFARWVPHCLTAEQKQKRLDIATLLNERFDVEDQAFLCRIVAIDGTWIRDFEPELKSQSNEWRTIGFPRQKSIQSKVKQMMIFVYDHQEVSCGRSVTGVYYCAFM